MKKVWKGFAAAVSAAAIAATGFIGATSANAAPAANTGTITLTETVPGDQYMGYRLLDITGISADGASVAYTVNSKYSQILKTALGLASNATDKAITDAISKLSQEDKVTGAGETTLTGGDSKNVRAFAAKVMQGIDKANLDSDVMRTAGQDTNSIVFDNIERGYYLFNQTINGEPGKYTDSSFIVNSALVESVTVVVKHGTVTLTKKLQDNDLDNADDTHNSIDDWIDSGDYNIGGIVPFQLTGTLPANLASYKTFNYIFHDTLSAGLTRITASSEHPLTVYAVNGEKKQKITNNFAVATTTPADPDADPKVGETFTVAVKNTGTEEAPIYDLKAITTDDDNVPVTIDSNTKIVVEYFATLNEHANIGSQGNPNTAYLEFSNNSNHDGTGETAQTPKDKVTVFTYQFNVNKTFNVGTPNEDDLPQFTLYKKNNNGNYIKYTNTVESSATKTVTVTQGADGKKQYTINWKGMDAGEYKLEESHTPAGYQTAAPIVFTITASHEILSNDPQLNSLTGTNTENHKVVTGTVTTGTLSTTIQNVSGSELPSTGGMGTTMLYVAGAAIVLIAGIGLAVTLRRRQA